MQPRKLSSWGMRHAPQSTSELAVALCVRLKRHGVAPICLPVFLWRARLATWKAGKAHQLLARSRQHLNLCWSDLDALFDAPPYSELCCTFLSSYPASSTVDSFGSSLDAMRDRSEASARSSARWASSPEGFVRRLIAWSKSQSRRTATWWALG